MLPPPSPPAYSAFPRSQITLIVCLASFAATFSPLSSFIFFPAIDDLARALDVSVGRVDLTITSYMIVTGVAPAVLGDLADHVGRRPVYLAICSSICLLLIALLLPETARSVVGNRVRRRPGPVPGSWPAAPNLLQKKKKKQKRKRKHKPRTSRMPPRGRRRQRGTMRLLWAKDTALVTLIFGVFYMNLSSLQASTSTLFVQIHGISGIGLGLVYLPSGIGSCIGAYYAGRLIDHDYRVVARKSNFEINKRAGDNLARFPIEKARFRSIAYVLGAAGLSMVGYGWSMWFKVMSGTLLVDIHPKSPSTAQAANSIVRAFLAGGGTACV
ncbi:hypothetical protein B0T22DRAFT_509877 [Podospora appendiculata]|uniref:Major facilitator superfamily (MFS) profile domain-containing protein n=1 Tax=Podospora appendiculata TaxID=314037 RepID=A0AAE0X6Y4_9PEZI|nr:hypothetical protein B0T22DRAFT_509877 [Podospora appendiculata]